ncbi:MAG: sigma 54-interacting transcriptional regulator [Deltaproteobacteria bacterium]|nr:sigma 54-interacting transcriptional regulator [Deltaproteobacteria bacterium]
MIKDDKLSNVIGTLQRLSSAIFSDAIQRKLILDNLTEGVFTVDTGLKITSLNKAGEAILGLSEEEAIGKDCHDVLFPRAEEKFCIIDQVLAEGRPLLKQTRVLKIEGKQIPVLVSASPLEDSNGEIVGGVQSFQEIREIFHRQLILDSFFDGVFTVDSELRITLFNKAAEKLTGYRQQEVVGRSFIEIFHAGDAKSAEDDIPLVRAIRTGRPVLGKSTSLLAADKRILPVSVQAAPLIDPHGMVIGGMEILRDNTGVIQSRHILDSVADGVFTVDHDFRITSFNRAAKNITGYRKEEVLGKRCSDVFCGSLCGTSCPLVKAFQTKNKVLDGDVIILGKMGKRIPVSICVTALVDDGNNIIGGVETFRDRTEILALRSRLVEESNQEGIYSKSKKMQKIISVLPEFAKSDSNILILGESGTGKEIIATAIHRMSRRSKAPFVAVNSGALPDTLLESELFGYKAGAFTDARQDKKGRFDVADQGTLFLDEIGDISPAMQVKLLRVLQSKTYEPLGSNTPVKTNARIIAATNKNLTALVENGGFREDLYYRLNVVKIELPPLRERMEDLPFLVEFFIGRYNRQRNKAVKGISEEALSLLLQADYSGNIRELENIIEYAFILCNEGYILPHHLPETLRQMNAEPATEQGPLPADENVFHIPRLTLDEIEKHVIIDTLAKNNFKRMQTCRDLGISKDTLRRKLSQYGDIGQPANEDLEND